MTDSTFSTLELAELDTVTGGSKWDLIKKAGKFVADKAKDVWKATPAPVKTGLLTAGAPGALGGGVAYLQHKFD
jgi:hypothetical protein